MVRRLDGPVKYRPSCFRLILYVKASSAEMP